MEDDDSAAIVVVNHEEQFSLWPINMAIPGGWRAEGFEGSRRECLDYIDRVWRDIRPLSMRRMIDDSDA
ncbi:MAG: MbtH family NRPS accessory protein [bacterium]|nr:MbtH family NRPS accessory protein [bacterium]